MDYIFFSSIIGVTLLAIAIPYDIVCQWKINIAERSRRLPEALTATLRNVAPIEERLHFSIPIWHANTHEDKCQVTNSLWYQPGVGKTDRQRIECRWSRTNPMGPSTKEMAQGAQHDALDDMFAYNNFERNIALGKHVPFTIQSYPSHFSFA